jgi:hypothetical protein
VAVVRAEKFLREHGVETDRGVAGVQQSIQSSTSIGGSAFVPSLLQSPVQAPRAVLTVLFRPLPHEAHNAQAFIASLESLFLLLFTLVRIPWGFAALGSMRRQPYVAFAFAYSAMFIVAFSAFANFGLLARERVQLLPFYVLFLCIPPRRKEHVPVPANDLLARWRAAR